MVAQVEDGRLVKVSGDHRNTYTDGKLCSKGYAYSRLVYHPQRITQPLLQNPRNSGNWQKITWDDAYNILTRNILETVARYGSTLPLALIKGSGNMGVLAAAMEGFFNSLGTTTMSGGDLCWAAARDARQLDFGTTYSKDPQEMIDAGVILLWGVNPAYNAIHQVPYLQQAREDGSAVILIDVYQTATAPLADRLIKVKPGGDGALALALAKELLERNLVDEDFLARRTTGWERFRDYLLMTKKKTLLEVCGSTEADVAWLAGLIGSKSPVAFWPGMGLQRYQNGGQNLRAIHALAAMSGSLDQQGGGVYFPHTEHWTFNHHLIRGGRDQVENHRRLAIGRLAEGLQNAGDPPVKLVWFSRTNILEMGTDLAKLKAALTGVDLVVTADYFLTSTAKASDLVLPVTTCFEMWDAVPSYWHNWIGLNQPAIEPVGECRSELTVARELAERLNRLRPGTSSFPVSLSDEDWLAEEFNPWLNQRLGIATYQELLQGPRMLQFEPFGETRYRFQAEEAMLQGCLDIPALVVPSSSPPAYPYRLLTPHRASGINSQFTELDWVADGFDREKNVIVSPGLAARKGLKNGERVILYNSRGEVSLKVQISARVSGELMVSFARLDLEGKSLNQLSGAVDTDLGAQTTGFKGTAYHENFVQIQRETL